MAHNKTMGGLPGLFSGQRNYAADNFYSTPNTGTINPNPNSNAAPAAIQPIKAGISGSLHVQRTRWIAPRWQWQASLGWQYQRTTQPTGGKKDSLMYLSQSNSFYSASFYVGGTGSTVIGHNHRIVLANNLAFSLLKSKKIFLEAGFYTGTNISNHFLIPDQTRMRLMDGDGYYKNWFFGASLGTSYHMKKGYYIGITANADLTKSFTPLSGKNQYWQSIQLTTGIPLSFIKK